MLKLAATKPAEASSQLKTIKVLRVLEQQIIFYFIMGIVYY